MPLWPDVFQFGIFLVLLCINPGVFSPEGLFWFLLFPCYRCVWLFCYIISVPIFCSKIVLLPLQLVVGMYSYAHHQLDGWFRFHYFGMFCFVSIVWLCLSNFFSPPSFARAFSFNSSSCIACFTCFVVFLFLSLHIPAFFHFLIILACCRFLIDDSTLISHPGFEFQLMFFFGEHRFYHKLISLLHTSSFNSLLLLLNKYDNFCFIFSTLSADVGDL